MAVEPPGWGSIDVDESATIPIITPSELEQARVNGLRLRSREPADPPWTFLAEQHSILQPAAKAKICEFASWSDDEFLSPLAGLDNNTKSLPASFTSKLPSLVPVGAAALRDDHGLRELRARLVPERVGDDEFWFAFFHHADQARNAVLPPAWLARERDSQQQQQQQSSVQSSPAASSGSTTGGGGAAVPRESARTRDADEDDDFERFMLSPAV